MGRFYETSQAQFLNDKMFELPVDMMYKAIQVKDKAVDDTISTAVSLFDKLKADVYISDSQRAREIINEKQNKIDEIVTQIQQSPGDYNKFSGGIRKLSRDIQETFTQPTGEIYLMEKNNKDIVSQIQAIKDKHKDDPAYAEAEIKALKDSYAQGLTYDAVSRRGTVNPNIVQTYELKHTVDDFIKNKLSANEWEQEKDTRGGDGYIYRNKTTREVLSPEKIAQAYQQYFNAHSDIQGAVNRRKELGLEDFVNADLSKAVEFNDKGEVAGLNNDWYGRNISAAIANMKYTKTKDSNTINNDQGYWTQAGWNREDAQKQTPEQVGWTYEHVYKVDANSAQTFQQALTNANVGLLDTYNKVLSVSGVSPNSELGKQILQGNSHAIQAALMKAEPATAKQLSQTYSSLRTQKNFLNAQTEGFKAFAKTKGFNVDTSKNGWLNPSTQKLYNDFLSNSNSLGKNNVPQNLVTMDKIGLPKETQTQLSNMLKQNFDDLVFNVDQTAKGSYMTFEKEDGNKVIYVPRGSKEAKIGTIKVNAKNGVKAHTVEYKVAPGGMLSVQTLIKDRLVTPSKDDKGNIIYTTRENGKKVGIVPDETTFGLDQALDDSGKTNYGMTMQMGNYRVPTLIPTEAINIPSVNKYVQENYEDLQFNQFLNKTNINTLGRATAPGPNGTTFLTEKGKAYVVSNGVKQEVTAPAQKREIYKIVFAEN